jgi:hypothetical protein
MVLWSTSGVQQGDPLGPLYFCFGLSPLVEEIAQLGPVYQKWYMDDGGIVGSADLLCKVWSILVQRGPALGLYLNPAKCEWSWLNASNKSPCPLQDVDHVPTEKICMLGVPLGSQVQCQEFVEAKLMGRLEKVMDRLADFQDAQAALYLLRVSFSIVRAVHFMRTTPLEKWMVQSRKFDKLVRTTAESILGFPFSEEQYRQACLTPTLGGLGLRRTEDHAEAAFAASWSESQSTAGEQWAVPACVVGQVGSQKQASFRIDKSIHDGLV